MDGLCDGDAESSEDNPSKAPLHSRDILRPRITVVAV